MEALEPWPKRHKPSTLEDRISNLPDSLLSHILSKLSTKLAAGTALLSTRWKNLISQIPNLKIDINDCELLTPHTTPNNHRNAIFTRYVYNLLTVTLRDVPRVRKCFMYLKQTYPDHDLNAWISAVVRLHVSCLWVFFQDNHVGLSSDVLFQSEFLSSLVLFNHNFMKIRGSVSLPILKTLILINITFLNGGLVERVISACPVLDSLSVSHCRIKEVVSVLRISSCSVKKVRLMMMSECCGDVAYEIVLDMPSLESLHYVDHLPGSYSVKNLNGVRDAYIDVGPSKKQFEEEEAEVMCHRLQSVRDLLGACSRIRSLFLSSISIAALGCSTRPFPTFPNLTELTLGCICTTLWELLPQILESAPSLEVLVFKGFSQCKGCYAKFQSNVPENVPRCLTLHLRTIKFEGFKGEEDEIDLVEYFLKHTQLLRNIKFEFSCSLSQDEISSTKSKLWSLRNHSRKSEVDFTFEVEIDDQKAMLLSHENHESSNELSK